MSDTGLNIPVTFDANEGQVASEAAKAGRLLAQGMNRGADSVEDRFRDTTNLIGREVQNATKKMASGYRQFETQAKAASSRIGSDLASNFARAGKEIEELTADAKALAAVIQAQKDRKFGIVDEKEFALLNRSLEKLQQFQKTVGKTNFNDPAATRQIRQQFAALQQEATKAKALFQTSTRDQVEGARIAARRVAQAELQAGRERNIELAKQASQAKFIAQREQQEILSNTQRTNQLRVQLTRSALETLARLERGFGATVAGIARTTTRALGRGYQDTLGRVSAAFSRNSSQIRSIEQSSATSRINIFRSAQRTQERILSQSVTRQTQIIQAAQAKSNAGIIGAARRSPGLGAIGGGLAGFGVLSLGLERFSNLERLTKQFTVLTGSAEQAAAVLDEVKQFARATPFDLVGVADLAKGFLAIKTPVDQVLPRVKAIADAVALTGGGVDELNRIQRAIGQVVSAGRLQGDELNQLAENLPGLNIREILAKQLTGGDQAALVAMQEAGEVSADTFVNALITGLSTDPRLVGASEDLAKTLSGRLANLKEVVADVGAAFIGLIAEPLKEATRLATIALDGLAQFIKGEISPAMQVLRTALGGAAAAIGALLAAKVAAEALKILAAAARLVLTPFGAIVTAIGLAGAAFAVLRDRSEEFRDVTDRLFRLLKTTGGNVFRAIGDAVERVRDAFATAREPISGTADALERAAAPARTFISEIGTKLGSAIAATGRFLTDTLIPAIADFVIFIGRNAGPALRAFRDILVDLGGKVADRARDGFEKLKPVISSVNDILGEVVDKVKGIAAGAGSLTALIPTGAAVLGGGLVAGPIGALVAGLAVGIATLSPTIRKSIVDGVKGARDEVVKVFSNIDWGGLASGALEFVRRVGFIIGNVVSDPRFVAALAGIAAAAVAIAFQFIRGFAEGVISNLGELVDLGSDIASSIFEGIADFVTSNPLDAALILGGAALAAAAISVGRQVAAGLASGLGTFKGNVQGGQDLLSSALFGRGGPNQFIKQSVRTAAQTADEVRRQLSTISRARGGGGILGVGIVDQGDIDRARRGIKSLEGTFGTAATAGLRLRTAFSDTFQSIRTNSQGIRGIFSSLSTGVGDAAAALRGQGAAIGSALGVGVIAGFGSAVSGQQLGSGNIVGGLGGILASSIGAGLVAGPAIGVAVGALGLLSAAWTSSKQAAEDYAAAVRGVADALTDVGVIAGEEAVQALKNVIGDQLKDEAAATKNALADAGITAQFLAEQLIAIGPSGSAAIKSVGETARGFAAQFATSGEGLERFADVGAGIPSILDKIRAVSPATAEALQQLVSAAQDGTISGTTFREAVDELFDNIDESGPGIADAAANLRVLGEAAKESAAGTANLFEARVAGTNFATAIPEATTLVEDLEGALQTAKDRVDELLNPGAGTLASEVGSAIGSLSGISSGIGAGLDLGGVLGGAQVNSEIESLRSKLASVVKKGLEEGASEAQIDDNLRVINAAINELDVPQEVKDAMFAEVQAAIDADTITADIQAVANVESAQQAAKDLGKAVSENIPTSGLEAPGRQVGEGFARGIRSTLDRVKAAIKQLTDAATNAANINLNIKSPSKVFEEIGVETAAGFTLGIINSLGFVEAAGTEMGDTFTDATVAAVSELNDRIAGLRLDLFGSLLGGTSGQDSALRSGQNAIRSLTDALAGPIQEAAEAGLAATRGIDFGAGLNNREAFAEVVEQIKAVGEGLLRAGFTPAQIKAELTRLRQQALDVAGFLGFDTATIDAFFTSLGLSASSLENFANQLLTETERLKREAEAEEAARRKEEADREKEEADRKKAEEDAKKAEEEARIEQTVNVNLALPFGDPEAVALAVANRTATLVRRR